MEGLVIERMKHHWQVEFEGKVGTGETPKRALADLAERVWPSRPVPQSGQWMVGEGVPTWLQQVPENRGLGGEQECPVCGCDVEHPCVHMGTGEPCQWELDQRCSACTEGGVEARVGQEVLGQVRALSDGQEGE